MRTHLNTILHSRRLWTAAGLALALLLIAAAALYSWLLADLPPIRSVELRAARPTTQILDRNGKLLYEVVDPDAGKQIDLSLDHVPQACVQATLATEDARFYAHFGVDPIAIARAVWQNLNGRAVVSGGSTLTQQIARTFFLSPEERYEQTLRRKLREAWLAFQLERTYTKDQLLALYLNQTYYGNFAFGLEAAAQVFFAKPAAQLSTAECALLAGLVQYPTGYNPLADPDTAKGRQLTVLRLMQEAGYLDADAAARVAAEPLRYRSRLFDIEAPHFVMYVQSLLVEQLGAERLRQGGLRVTTTLDLDLQQAAEAAVRRRLAALTCAGETACTDPAARDRRVDNAAAVILDSRTGEILAMVGSPDYFNQAISGNVNAALSPRQPGSAIKPFTYAAALDGAWSSRGGQPPLTAASILPDLPQTFYVENADGQSAAYRPQNYDRIFHGPVSVRAALANSYNVPAVEVLNRVGVETLRDLAAGAGIRTFNGRYGLALTLGGGDVRLLELTAAYGIFDDGRSLPPQAIIRLTPDAAEGGMSEPGCVGWKDGQDEESEPRFVGWKDLQDRVLATGTPSARKPSCKSSNPTNRGSDNPMNRGSDSSSCKSLNPTNRGSDSSSCKSSNPTNRGSDIPSGAPVISPQAAYLITDILSDDVARRPAFGSGSVLQLPFPAAVKTGTTTDWRDNWTVGYSTERIVGVWVGNADNSPMVDVSGVDGAGPIWHDLMLLAHRTPPRPFTAPEGIVELQICAASGMLPSADCPRLRRERFIDGTQPREADTQFRRLTIDRATGDLADAQTPAARRAERVYWLLPPEYHDWMVQQGIALAPPGAQAAQNGGLLAARGETANAAGASTAAAASASASAEPLRLTSPASYTTYQLHPGLDAASQQLQAAGYTGDGRRWASLRLLVDGEVLAQAADAARLTAWWPLTLGRHTLWLEGEPTAAAATLRSAAVQVNVTPFTTGTVTLQTVD